MTYTMEQYEESAQAIRARLKGFVPKVAMVLGSGLGFLGDQVEDPIAIDYHDIPHFKASTAPGHKGRLVCGMLDGQRVAVMQGRMHHYEGYSYEEVSYAVRVLRLLGCDTLVVTNAAGCVRQDWHAGELMLITDQIKMFSPSPLRGENLPQFGPRFPDASHLYSPRSTAAGPGRRPGAGADPAGGHLLLLLRPPVRDPCRDPGRPDIRGRRRGHVHRAGGHRGRPLRHGGAGPDPAVQHGRGHPGPAPVRAGGLGCRRGRPGDLLRPGPGLPSQALIF